MIETSSDRPPVRVLIVDDSAFMRIALKRIIDSEAAFQVVATASSGRDALTMIPALDPDVITLDVHMPGMDGLQTLRHIMNDFPRPVIMVSALTETDAEITLNALSIGAFDCVPKQLSDSSLEIAHIRADLVSKIHAAAAFRHPTPENPLFRKPAQPVRVSRPSTPPGNPAIVAIASSTGGPRALEEILPRFPADFPLPILVVQHMPPGFITSFARRLSSLCTIDVHEARHLEIVHPGVAYISPSAMHMRIQRRTEGGQVFILLDRIRGNALHMPSADLLFESVARVYGNCALGVILTGMGCDGAQGVQAIYRAGGITIGQDEASCTVYGMPRACADLGVLTRTLPLSQIPEQILLATRRRMPA